MVIGRHAPAAIVEYVVVRRQRGAGGGVLIWDGMKNTIFGVGVG